MATESPTFDCFVSLTDIDKAREHFVTKVNCQQTKLNLKSALLNEFDLPAYALDYAKGSIALNIGFPPP